MDENSVIILADLSGNPELAKDANGAPITGYGFLTPGKFGMMLIFIYPWIVEMSSLFPPVVQELFNPWVTWGLGALGAVTALTTALAGGSMLAVPGALSTVKSMIMPQAAAPQRGGAKLPQINDIIYNVLDNTKELPAQEGGASAEETDEGIMFLGSLAIVSLAGISLALVRSKKASEAGI